LNQGIRYGQAERQELDIYRPTKARSTPAPVVIFFYGGSWNSGDKGDYRFVGQLLASNGFLVVIPDYRLYPTVKFPTFLEDGAVALRWTQDRIAAYGGDPKRLFLMGHSAGAYNAMMLGLDQRYGAAAGFKATHLCGIVGLAGPYDFKFDTDLLRGIFGSAPDSAAALPVTYANHPAPPVLLITGDADRTVNPANSFSLARHLKTSGNSVRLTIYPELDHIDILLQLSSFWTANSPLRSEVIDFLAGPGRCGRSTTFE
jgi:acetyl esterase/lipase